jgi:hypothetical protein
MVKNRDVQQAQLESELQFHPQECGLAQLLASARSDYLGQRRHIKGATAGIIAGLHRAKPQLAADYDVADETRSQGAALVQASLAGLGSGADAFHSPPSGCDARSESGPPRYRHGDSNPGFRRERAAS